MDQLANKKKKKQNIQKLHNEKFDDLYTNIPKIPKLLPVAENPRGFEPIPSNSFQIALDPPLIFPQTFSNISFLRNLSSNANDDNGNMPQYPRILDVMNSGIPNVPSCIGNLAGDKSIEINPMSNFDFQFGAYSHTFKFEQEPDVYPYEPTKSKNEADNQ